MCLLQGKITRERDWWTKAAHEEYGQGGGRAWQLQTMDSTVIHSLRLHQRGDLQSRAEQSGLAQDLGVELRF